MGLIKNYYRLSFVLLIVLQSCCTSNLRYVSDCNCDSSYTELDKSSREWLKPYKSSDSSVFINQANSDTLIFNYKIDTSLIRCGGGDECFDSCEAEEIQISSGTNESQIIVGSFNDKFQVNYSFYYGLNTGYAIWLYYENDSLVNFDTFISSQLLHDYSWNNQELTVLLIECMDTNECDSYRRILISKELGILEFTDTNGNDWNLIE